MQPRDTQWFGFYAPGQDVDIVPMEQSELYTNDRLGLRQMNENGQLVLIESPGNHLQFTQPWFVEHIMPVLVAENPPPK